MNENVMKKLAMPVYWISGASLCVLLIQQAGGNHVKVFIQTVCFILAIGIGLFIKRKNLDIKYIKIRDKHDTPYYVFTLVFMAIAIAFFQKAWCYYFDQLGFLKQLGISPSTALKTIPFVLAALAFPATVCGLKYLLRDYLDVRQNVWEDNKYLCKATTILAGIYCFAIVAIIRSDFIYKDDMQRLTSGYTVYGRESRFVAEFVTFFQHFDEFFADSSPLPQLTEMVIMAIFAMIVYSALAPKIKPGFYAMLAMIPFALCPYFLEGVSFKYDSPQHALAALFAALPFLYWRKDRKKFLVASVVCLPLMCMSHQVVLMFYPSVVVLLCALTILDGEWKFKDAAIFAGQSALAYICAVGVYRFGILRLMPLGQYTATTTMLGVSDLVPGAIRNYREFFGIICDDFNIVSLVLMAIICISFVVILVKTATIKRGQALWIALACLVLLLAFSNSLYPLLCSPVQSPRHLYSFGLFLGLVTLTCAIKFGERDIVPKAALILLASSFIVFAFIYGNALSQQKEYTRYRMEMIQEVLTEITSEHPETTYSVQLVGTSGYAPTIDAMPESLNMIRRLVPVPLSEYYHGWWASGICDYYGLNVWYFNSLKEDYQKIGLKLYQKNIYQAIYADDEHILIVLEDR